MSRDKVTQTEDIFEDAGAVAGGGTPPTNNVGSGAIAGAGIGNFFLMCNLLSWPSVPFYHLALW